MTDAFDAFATHLDRRAFEVRDLDVARARALVEAHHYAGGAANTRVYTHGLFVREDDHALGVAWWMPPTPNAARSVNREEWKRVLNLSRLVVVPDMPTNSASFLLAGSIRIIRRLGVWTHLVTYADPHQGHTGAIYRATNWTEVPGSGAQPIWADAEGRRVARKATRTRTNEEMRALGHRVIGISSKRKFVMDLTR